VFIGAVTCVCMKGSVSNLSMHFRTYVGTRVRCVHSCIWREDRIPYLRTGEASCAVVTPDFARARERCSEDANQTISPFEFPWTM
jgi:hypothetical protein